VCSNGGYTPRVIRGRIREVRMQMSRQKTLNCTTDCLQLDSREAQFTWTELILLFQLRDLSLGKRQEARSETLPFRVALSLWKSAFL
jgi:hypothetical protein